MALLFSVESLSQIYSKAETMTVLNLINQIQSLQLSSFKYTMISNELLLKSTLVSLWIIFSVLKPLKLSIRLILEIVFQISIMIVWN